MSSRREKHRASTGILVRSRMCSTAYQRQSRLRTLIGLQRCVTAQVKRAGILTRHIRSCLIRDAMDTNHPFAGRVLVPGCRHVSTRLEN
jgi:hypothetical protein